MKTHSKYKTIAHKLLQIKEVPTTEVCEYIYGSKTKKSTLNQKKTGLSPIQLNESTRIIEFYGGLADRITKILDD